MSNSTRPEENIALREPSLIGVVDALKMAQDVVSKGATYSMLLIGLLLIVVPTAAEMDSIASLDGLNTGQYIAAIGIGTALMAGAGIIRLIESTSISRNATLQMIKYYEVVKASKPDLPGSDPTNRV